MKHRLLFIALAAGLLPITAEAARFTYHGELLDGELPADGRYDLRLRALGSPRAVDALAPATELPAVAVVDGRFSVELDLPEATGTTWIEVAVREAGQGDYAVLGSPQPVTKANSTCPGAWALDGNSGVPVGSFLGFADPADPTPLDLVVAGERVARLAAPPTSDFGHAPTVVMGSVVNTASGAGATVAGGGSTRGGSGSQLPCLTCGNSASGNFATVSGGRGNIASGGVGTVAGGTNNTASGVFSTVGGGTGNVASGNDGATVAGGENNQAAGFVATVAGGSGNRANGSFAAAGGGEGNRALGEHATIAGGRSGTARGNFAAIAGGRENLASGFAASVVGGAGNIASGKWSLAAGQSACAGGDFSVALGNNAEVRPGNEPEDTSCGGSDTSGDSDGDTGSFVFADAGAATFRTTGDNQFLVRAAGGVGINTPPLNASIELTIESDADDTDFASLWLKQKSVNDNGILISTGDGGASNNAGFYIDHFNGGAQARRLELAPSGAVTIRSNVTQANTGVSMAANAGSWSSLSDRRLKTAIETIDPVDILDRLLALPISRWSYTAQGPGIRHLGPMAQDFAAAFGLGENTTTIATIDADGVALAAIQGLSARLASENAALRARLAAVEARLDALAAQQEPQR